MSMIGGELRPFMQRFNPLNKLTPRQFGTSEFAPSEGGDYMAAPGGSGFIRMGNPVSRGLNRARNVRNFHRLSQGKSHSEVMSEAVELSKPKLPGG
jgi:hypothetical protein